MVIIWQLVLLVGQLSTQFVSSVWKWVPFTFNSADAMSQASQRIRKKPSNCLKRRETYKNCLEIDSLSGKPLISGPLTHVSSPSLFQIYIASWKSPLFSPLFIVALPFLCYVKTVGTCRRGMWIWNTANLLEDILQVRHVVPFYCIDWLRIPIAGNVIIQPFFQGQ